ncbi:vWA domain-containing protein [Dethiobacter alkaliphilus]|uniref:vWA domain-containing protein n=1 Tax=Dethiobacter alkaliphilus TaxID=427926 RepID=UPI002226A9EC|nr:vWA domain-containing protein [Dethiobacter alkaliphilus]MCW3490808.1 VWA domain-containing protein [Dethiobacter alkaliphilus]
MVKVAAAPILAVSQDGGEMQVVENEIRRLQRLQEEKTFQRYHYRCVRHGQNNEGFYTLRETQPRQHGCRDSLAVAETMICAARRRLTSGDAQFLRNEDFRVIKDGGAPPLEVCLLVDTSGSMNGKRIREVKTLADNLVRQMHEPLSLITFQEGDVGVKVRSTRNDLMVRRGLAAMSAAGLTPMGEGIRTAVNYLCGRRGKKHLVILITDGLPTWASGDQDPYLDAIEAGALIKKHKMHLICIGLEPQRKFLEKLAESADASLYIVDDLDHREIAAITRRERSRVGSLIPT